MRLRPGIAHGHRLGDLFTGNDYRVAVGLGVRSLEALSYTTCHDLPQRDSNRSARCWARPEREERSMASMLGGRWCVAALVAGGLMPRLDTAVPPRLAKTCSRTAVDETMGGSSTMGAC